MSTATFKAPTVDIVEGYPIELMTSKKEAKNFYVKRKNSQNQELTAQNIIATLVIISETFLLV